MRICRKWKIRPHEVEDFVQDARFRVWRVYSKPSKRQKPPIAVLVQRAMADTARRFNRWRMESAVRRPGRNMGPRLQDHDLHRYITKHASPRMRQVLSLRLQGFSGKKIAYRMRLGPETVDMILRKLQRRYRMGTQ